MKMLHLFRAYRQDESGTTAIEFSIIGFVMILVMLGTIEFGRGLIVHNEIAYLADVGARKVLIDPTIADGALADEMRNVFSKDRGLLQIAISTDVVDGMKYCIIAIAYPMNLLVPGLSSRALNLTAIRRVPVG